jgi:S-DNA-T family DNA segregation ATPase FtsK/SpoIIIE
MPPRSTPVLPNLSASPAPVLAIRIPLRLAGIVLLLLVAAILLSLASWSVDDPSLSYATSHPAGNWLGFPGAVLADIIIQVFGIAILPALVPPVLWAWNFLRRRAPTRMGLRFLCWLGATLLITGVCAFIAVPASWPLPTGLGGLLGSAFFNLATLVGGAAPTGITPILFSIILLSPAAALLWLAFGLDAFGKPGSAVNAKGRPSPDRDDEPERDSIFDVAIGGLVHMGYSARTAFRRARANARTKQEAEAASFEEPELDEPEVEARGPVAPSVHAEPPLAVAAPRRPINIARGPVEPEFEDDPPFDADEDEDDFVPEPMPVVSVQPEARPVPVAPRISAPPARPVQGARVTREAQGSLLDEPRGFELPALSLLAEPKHKGPSPDHAPERLEATARRLEGVLEDFGVKGDIINVRPGPVVTLYELEPAPGIKSSRVISLADDIARSMSAISARVAVVPGRNAIGIELPNENRETVYLREMLASTDFEKMKGKLPICLGKTIGGEPIIADLAKMPHLLIAGTTGSGKSVGINTMILSLLYQMTPEQCRLIMIDPKMLELSIYDGIPHLLTPVVTDPSKAVVALKWAVREMEDRYRKMSKIGVRNIDGFNQRVGEARARGDVITRTVQTGFDRETGEAIFESEAFDLQPLPYIVVIVDEMADLMMVAGKDIEGSVQRLAQMARAAGIHVITATQRPSVDVITGTIKANFPTRISFMVTSKIDSRTILGEQGAETLLGNGDMLYMAGGGRIKRLHGPFVSDSEVESIVNHLKSQGSPDYLEAIVAEEDEDDVPAGDDDFGGSGDELYDKAVNIVLQDKKASTSYIQRRLAIGYNKAATLIERMEKEGVISQANHAGKREILVGGD